MEKSTSENPEVFRGWTKIADNRYIFRFSVKFDDKEHLFRSARVKYQTMEKFKDSRKSLMSQRRTLKGMTDKKKIDSARRIFLNECKSVVDEINGCGNLKINSLFEDIRTKIKTMEDKLENLGSKSKIQVLEEKLQNYDIEMKQTLIMRH